jgi:hypothetical protein
MIEPRDEKPKSYGRTRSGLEITDEMIERYVAEAEAGFDLDRLRPVPPEELERRRKGRSPE